MDFEGSSIFYAATEIEARPCAGRAVVVLGGVTTALESWSVLALEK
jgi:hypothetical protein